VGSDQLSAQPHNCRSNSEKKIWHNIEQHLYSFEINWDWTRDPKESIHSICDVSVFTVPRYKYYKYQSLNWGKKECKEDLSKGSKTDHYKFRCVQPKMVSGRIQKKWNFLGFFW
jgi:hypothetical protein